MILTAKKKKDLSVKDGTYNVKITSYKEVLVPVGKYNQLAIKLVSGQTQLDLILDINDSLPLMIGKIAYLGGLLSGDKIDLPAIIDLKISVTIKAGKIIKIKKSGS